MTVAIAYARLMAEAEPYAPCGGITSRRAKTRNGYMQLDVGGGVRIYAHRIVWEANYGPIPDDLRVLHKCDEPSCFEIKHLFLGTVGDNNADRDVKGRGVIPDTRGTRHGMHKLTEAEVIAIYRSGLPGKLLAEQYAVAKSCVSKIRNGQAWRHLTKGLGERKS